MPTLTEDLAKVLRRVNRPGDFYACGVIELLQPRLEVDGVGPIALPLLPVQAEQLVAAAERAPFGRGTETVLDVGVRRTWQIDAGRVRIGGAVPRDAISDPARDPAYNQPVIDVKSWKALTGDCK